MLNDIEGPVTPGVAVNTLRRMMTGKVKLWENCRWVLADVPLNKKETNRMLPLLMRVSDPPTATFFIVDYTKPAFTVPYREAAMLIHVKTPFGQGLHCCWMAVDDDTALIYGRELLGYPKKGAEFEFNETDEGIKASVTRRGVKVLEIEAMRGEKEEKTAPVLGYKTFNCGGPWQAPALNPIWLFKPNEVIHEACKADSTVALDDSELDPVARMVSGPLRRSRIAVTDILGSHYMLPVGIAGLKWFSNTFNMRFR